MSLITYSMLTFAAVWLLAVYKVIVIDDDLVPSPKKMQNEILSEYTKDQMMFISQRDSHKERNWKNLEGKPEKGLVKVPISAEWMFIRNSKDYKVESREFVKEELDSLPLIPKVIESKKDTSSGIVANLKKPAYALEWPPVLPDGTIAVDEGEEEMPLIGLKVPRFWEPPSGTTNQELHEMGRKVNEQETIFLMIASYRDFQCRETITSAFSRSDHPERLFVGAVDQTVPGDIGCLDIDIPCSQDPSQPICKYRDQISIYHMDAKYATGPVTARHVGDRMYRNEYFVMQMDAHCMFVRHWDTKLIQQWRNTGNEMAVMRYFQY